MSSNEEFDTWMSEFDVYAKNKLNESISELSETMTNRLNDLLSRFERIVDKEVEVDIIDDITDLQEETNDMSIDIENLKYTQTLLGSHSKINGVHTITTNGVVKAEIFRILILTTNRLVRGEQISFNGELYDVYEGGSPTDNGFESNVTMVLTFNSISNIVQIDADGLDVELQEQIDQINNKIYSFSATNLIYNSNFAINSEGKESYNANGECVDLWYQTHGVLVTPTSTGVTVVRTIMDEADYFFHYFYPISYAVNEMFTLQVQADNIWHTMTFSIPAESIEVIDLVLPNNHFVRVTPNHTASVFTFHFIVNEGVTEPLTIQWVKLERNPIPTPYIEPVVGVEDLIVSTLRSSEGDFSNASLTTQISEIKNYLEEIKTNTIDFDNTLFIMEGVI